MPACSGVRDALALLQPREAETTLLHRSWPPRLRGVTWLGGGVEPAPRRLPGLPVTPRVAMIELTSTMVRSPVRAQVPPYRRYSSDPQVYATCSVWYRRAASR